MIRLSKSSISELEKKAVLQVLDQEHMGMGAEVQKFEEKLTEFFGRPAVAVATGTVALQLALQAADIGCGDEVLVQSLTYVASFQAISATGAIPVACDVEAETVTIDLKDAERRLTEATKAIMPVHYAGGVGDLSAVYEFAETHNLRVIEDAAHAFGTVYNERRVGGFGDVSCFSFDGIKNITSGEGGCVISEDADLLERIRDLRLLGVERDTDNRFKGARSWDFDVHHQGWRSHMSNIMAAIGTVQLSRFQDLAGRRQNLASRYVTKLKGYPKLSLLRSNYSIEVPHIFPVILENNQNRDGLRASLLSRGIETGIHYKPAHHLSFYLQPGDSIELPVTENICGRLLTLPLHPDLTFEDVEFVVKNIKELLG
jgi:dTDP-4-amino-4,6-dideoxygalactose transaminase